MILPLTYGINTIDLLVIRGKSAPKTKESINNRHQKSVGDKAIAYITNPDVSSAANTETKLFSLSNCAIAFGPFAFESWLITTPSPGKFNHCAGGIAENNLPVCQAPNLSASGSAQTIDSISNLAVPQGGQVEESMPSISVPQTTPMEDTQVPQSGQVDESMSSTSYPQTTPMEDTSCDQKVTDMIIDAHEQELQSVLSKELKVTGDDLVSGTYFLTDELNHASGMPIYEKEVSATNINTYYIYHASDNIG